MIYTSAEQVWDCKKEVGDHPWGQTDHLIGLPRPHSAPKIWDLQLFSEMTL